MKNINCIMKWIVEKIDRDSDNVQINFNDESWRKTFPREPVGIESLQTPQFVSCVPWVLKN